MRKLKINPFVKTQEMRKQIILFVVIPLLVIGLSPIVNATETFSNNFESTTEISSDGGIIQGSSSFVSGVDGNAINLIDGSAVSFPYGDFPATGTIEFWVKPEFDIKNMPKYSAVGLLEVGDFPSTDTFGVWVYKSQFGPVVIAEIKDSEGNYRQVWSRVTSFKPDKWHHIALVWKLNRKKAKKNAARIYVDGRPGKPRKRIARAGIDLTNKNIRIGTTGYYVGMTKSIDKLQIFDRVKKAKKIRRDYKRFRK